MFLGSSAISLPIMPSVGNSRDYVPSYGHSSNQDYETNNASNYRFNVSSQTGQVEQQNVQPVFLRGTEEDEEVFGEG